MMSLSLVAAACSSGSEPAATPQEPAATPAETTPAPAPTEAAATPETEPASAETTIAPDEAPAPTEAPVEELPAEAGLGTSAVYPTLPPPTGEEMVVGFVNSEGTPGLDFPEMRVNVEAAVEYLNQHGGIGDRPIKLETCAVKGSPETSQACAQELAGKKVELVLIGLDLFPDYATYTAADIPVIGVLPILPGDYAANALFLTGGNATTTAAMAAVAKDHYGAKTVAIVSADNPGANGTEASLTAALDLAGIAHTTVKGGDSETDAGYQGLMAEASKDNPDVLFSLYADDGCIGTMRGRAALGITIPTITTAICSGKTVLDEVGDDALGWTFIGVQTQEETPELAILQEMLAPALGLEPAEVDSTALGLGALSVIEIMSLATYAGQMQANGEEVTGKSLYAYVGSATGLTQWPSGSPVECGASPKYPAICSFTFPVSEYQAGGAVVTIPGLEAVSARDYLP